MKTIHKYPINIVDEQQILLPENAIIISTAIQRGVLCLWAIVDTEEKMESRTIRIVGTGHEMYSDDLRFIGTVQQMEGQFIWHVFEKRKR